MATTPEYNKPIVLAKYISAHLDTITSYDWAVNADQDDPVLLARLARVAGQTLKKKPAFLALLPKPISDSFDAVCGQVVVIGGNIVARFPWYATSEKRLAIRAAKACAVELEEACKTATGADMRAAVRALRIMRKIKKLE